MNILEIRGLTKHFDRFTLGSMDLDIPQGCITGLVGENGAGKSTLLKSVLGLVRPDSGEIRFCGDTLCSGAQMEEIGVVFDALHFSEKLTPVQIGRVQALTYRHWDAKAYDGYLRQFSLPGDSLIGTFSKGMQMKLGIAAALSHGARLLLLDEPTAGLDPIAREELLDIFLDFVQDETHSILFSTHITTDLERIADYVTFLHGGRVLFTQPKDVLHDRYRLVRCGEKDLRQLSAMPGAVWRRLDYHYEVLLPDGAALEKQFPGCVFDRASIDEIMLLYTKGSQGGKEGSQ